MLYAFRLWVYRYVYGMAYCCHSTKQSHWSTSRNVIHRQNFHPPSSWYHRSVYPKCHAFVLVEAVSVRQLCAQCIRHELVVCLVPYLQTGWDQWQFNIIKRQNGTGSSAVVTRGHFLEQWCHTKKPRPQSLRANCVNYLWQLRDGATHEVTLNRISINVAASGCIFEMVCL